MRKHTPLYNLVRAELRRAGRDGIYTTALLGNVVDRHKDFLVKPGHLRAVLSCLQAQGLIQCEGLCSALRGMPLRVYLKHGTHGIVTPSSVEDVEALEAFEARLGHPQNTGTELRILESVAALGAPSRAQIGEAVSGGEGGQLRRILRHMAGPWRLLERAKRQQRGGGFTYSLTSAGRQVLATHSQPMAAR